MWWTMKTVIEGNGWGNKSQGRNLPSVHKLNFNKYEIWLILRIKRKVESRQECSTANQPAGWWLKRVIIGSQFVSLTYIFLNVFFIFGCHFWKPKCVTTLSSILIYSIFSSHRLLTLRSVYYKYWRIVRTGITNSSSYRNSSYRFRKIILETGIRSKEVAELSIVVTRIHETIATTYIEVTWQTPKADSEAFSCGNPDNKSIDSWKSSYRCTNRSTNGLPYSD